MHAYVGTLDDVYVKRGADVASDHPLLIAKLKLKLKRNWTGDSCQRLRYYTTILLKDTTKQQPEFNIVPINKFQVFEELLEEEEAINSRTWAGKARAYEEYSHASTIVKTIIKTDRRECMNMLATETEAAAHQGDLRELYTTIKNLSGKFGKPERPANDKGGKPVPDEEGQKKRWMEHFKELLNRPALRTHQMSYQPMMTYKSPVIHPPRRN